MSDDLDFEMEVVETDRLEDLGSSNASSDSQGGRESAGRNESEGSVSRKTVCGEAPSDWIVKRLGQVAEVVSGNSLPKDLQTGEKGEYPVYKVSDMNTRGNEKYLGTSANYLSAEEIDEAGHSLHPAGSTVLPKVGAALLTNKRRILSKQSSFDNNIMGWVPWEVNDEFLYYVASATDLRGVSQMGAVPSISKSIAQKLKIPYPPLPEQRKIASVLYAVDQAIQKTEEIIQQAKRVKRGLMQEVLSYGLDNKGNIRNPERDPQDFQELDLGGFEERLVENGRIPKSWEYVPLESCLSDFVSGAAISSGEFSESGFPVVAKGDVTGDEIIELSSDRQYVPEGIAEKYSKSVVDPTYMVVSLRDLVPSAPTVGSASFVKAESEFLLAQGAYGLLADEKKLDPKFFVSLTRSHYFRSYMKRMAVGSTQVHVRSSEYKKMHIPLPPIEEQRRISSLLTSIDEENRGARRESDRLRRLKKGLMQDLLTGEVRTVGKAIEVLDKVTAHG